MICDYGCGKEAKHQFKNGKWCCSKTTNGCPIIKEKLSELKKNKTWEEIYGKEYADFFKEKRRKELKDKSFVDRYGFEKAQLIKQKISIKNKNKIISDEHKDHIRKAQTNKIVSKQQKAKQRASMLGRKDSSYTKKLKSKKGLLRYKNIKEKIKFKLSLEDIFERYPTFSKIEEMRYNPDKPGEKEIQVHCKNHKCKNSKEQGGWFTPTRTSFYERIRQIENTKGTNSGYLYCSDDCKQECPLYGKTVNQLIKEDQIRAGYLEEPWYNSKEYQIWREQVFKLDNKICIWCGKEATIAHHILPQKSHPELSLDPDNGLSCCESCHYKYGHRDKWCTTGYLSGLICDRIVKIKNKKENLNNE